MITKKIVMPFRSFVKLSKTGIFVLLNMSAHCLFLYQFGNDRIKLTLNKRYRV